MRLRTCGERDAVSRRSVHPVSVEPSPQVAADAAAALLALGGVASRAALVAEVGRAEVDRCLDRGGIAVLRRGVYAVPGVDESIRLAHACAGVLSLTSAALHHGWAVKAVPERPHIIVARGRVVAEAIHRRAELHRADLVPDQIVDGVVASREVTLLQCLRRLPGDEALAVADSALRAGEAVLLRRVAAQAVGPGARQVRRIAALARADAANPFESVLRWICLGVEGLRVEPQVLITSVEPWARVDLADRDLRIVAEADSFEWHGDRAALRRDARRYDSLVADGWLVLRFAWEDVMSDPEFVRRTLVSVVALVQRSTDRQRDEDSAA